MTVDLTAPPPEDDEDREGVVDALFEVLSNERRRFVLHQLYESGGEAELPVIARRLAEHEEGIPPDELGESDEKRIYNALYQTHLPKLERHGLVTYDDETRTVALADEDPLRYVRRLYGDPPTPDRRRYVVSLVVSGAGGVAIGYLLVRARSPEEALAGAAVAVLAVVVLWRTATSADRTPESPFEEFDR